MKKKTEPQNIPAFMVATMKAGVSPLPKALVLAFAETVLRRPLPLPIGLLFHTVWVTAFSVAYVGRDELSFMRALWLAAGLWILVLVFFFPIVGWGLLGLVGEPQANRGRGGAALAVCVLPLGAVPLGLQKDTAGVPPLSLIRLPHRGVISVLRRDKLEDFRNGHVGACPGSYRDFEHRALTFSAVNDHIAMGGLTL